MSRRRRPRFRRARARARARARPRTTLRRPWRGRHACGQTCPWRARREEHVCVFVCIVHVKIVHQLESMGRWNDRQTAVDTSKMDNFDCGMAGYPNVLFEE